MPGRRAARGSKRRTQRLFRCLRRFRVLRIATLRIDDSPAAARWLATAADSRRVAAERLVAAPAAVASGKPEPAVGLAEAWYAKIGTKHASLISEGKFRQPRRRWSKASNGGANALARCRYLGGRGGTSGSAFPFAWAHLP